jgi:ATP-dependent Clp protease ATP-binding subunit ClpC
MATFWPGWDPVGVFERFTDRARRVLVLAQEEARLLNHNFIGTEHILLGLIHEEEGVAAKAIDQCGISFDDVRAKVLEIVGSSSATLTGSPPFTPRAKKVLELSLREALQLGHNYIGTEHILLGLVREGDGVAAQVFVSLGVDLAGVRQQVIRLVSGYQAEYAPTARAGLRRGAVVECSFCGRRPPESGQLISGRGGAYVCERCVGEFRGRLADTGDRPTTTTEPVIITGRTPADTEAARMEIALALGHALVLSDDRRTVPGVEGGELLGSCLKEAQERHAGLRRKESTVTIDRIEFIDEEHASVTFAIALEGLSPEPLQGRALVVDSVWKVARTTFCELMSLAGVECPPTS